MGRPRSRISRWVSIKPAAAGADFPSVTLVIVTKIALERFTTYRGQRALARPCNSLVVCTGRVTAADQPTRRRGEPGQIATADSIRMQRLGETRDV